MKWIHENLILSFPYSNNSKIDTALLDVKFNKFLKSYYTNLKRIDVEFPILTVDYIEEYTANNVYYRIYYTYPFNNHPFLIYIVKSDAIKEYAIVVPIGNRVGQVNLNVIIPLVPYFTPIERIAMIELTIRSIAIRQYNLITHPKYSILNCYIIGECIDKVGLINQSPLSTDRKEKLINETEIFFINKIHILLDRFFVILNENKLDAATRFINGEYNRFFVNQGLSKIFINSKDLIGHLEIFIHLYRLLHMLKNYK
jgi:hypothetical protein